MNKKIISLILGLMCVLLSYGIAAQIKTINGTGSIMSTNAKENELRDSVLKSKEKYDNLYQKLEEAENQLEVERANSTQNNTELTDLENEIKDGNKILGLSEVTGNGLIITINDNQDISLNSWFADPNLLVVHDADLISVVNELKNAGAEAISINEQRLVTTSAIECDGNIIKVNGEKIGAPFTIKAIGLPEVLINVDRFGGYLDNLRETRYLKVSIEKATDKKTITIPKYTGILKFQYAVSK
ncbi:MAG: DUF881 domain-containing protein [Clostridia bacterium]